MMHGVQTDLVSDPSSAASQEPRHHYCRGCGRELPFGFRGHFHKQCLRADKRRRICEQRKREQERFERLLWKQRCPHCGVRYGDQRSDGNVETPCEASQTSQDRDLPPG